MPKTPCRGPGCAALLERGTGGYCPRCSPAMRKPNPRSAGLYDASWIKFRAAFLAGHPFCVDCDAAGIVTPANEVHHRRSIHSNPELRLVESNVVPLCKSCHGRRGGKGEA